MGGHAWSVADPAEGFCTSFEKQLEINAVKTGPGGHTKAHKAVRSEACRVALAIAGTSITAFSRRRRSDPR